MKRTNLTPQQRYYQANREKILEMQKVYRETHKDWIKEKRQLRSFERRYINPKKPQRTRSEINHDYYLRHREAIIERVKARNKQLRDERRNNKQHSTARHVAGGDGSGTSETRG